MSLLLFETINVIYKRQRYAILKSNTNCLSGHIYSIHYRCWKHWFPSFANYPRHSIMLNAWTYFGVLICPIYLHVWTFELYLWFALMPYPSQDWHQSYLQNLSHSRHTRRHVMLTFYISIIIIVLFCIWKLTFFSREGQLSSVSSMDSLLIIFHCF